MDNNQSEHLKSIKEIEDEMFSSGIQISEFTFKSKDTGFIGNFIDEIIPVEPEDIEKKNTMQEKHRNNPE